MFLYVNQEEAICLYSAQAYCPDWLAMHLPDGGGQGCKKDLFVAMFPDNIKWAGTHVSPPPPTSTNFSSIRRNWDRRQNLFPLMLVTYISHVGRKKIHFILLQTIIL
jgi:hypothetical protein